MFDIKKYIIQNAFREKYCYHRYHKMYNMRAYILESKIQEIWEVENGCSVCRFAFFYKSVTNVVLHLRLIQKNISILFICANDFASFANTTSINSLFRIAFTLFKTAGYHLARLGQN